MIHRSPFAAHPIPDVSLPRFVCAWKAPPGRAAFIDGATGATTTYCELQRHAQGLSRALVTRGFGKAEAFALLLPNCASFAVALLGVTAAGGVVAPIDPQLTPADISRRLGASGATWMLTLPTLLDKARAAVAMTPASRRRVRVFVVLGDEPGAVSFGELTTGEVRGPQVRISAQDDLALLPCASDVNGALKAIMLTHFNVVAQLVQLDAVWPSEEDGAGTRVLAAAPFSHVPSLLAVLLHGLRRGRTLVMLPRTEPDAFLRLLEQHAVTLAAFTPPSARALVQHEAVGRDDLAQLERLARNGGPAQLDGGHTCFTPPACQGMPGYGITEMTGAVALRFLGVAARPRAVGQLLPGCEARIVDPVSRRDLGTDEAGELWLRGPNRMLGYLGHPPPFEPEGWLRTGDIARFDANGYLTLVDGLEGRTQDKTGRDRRRSAARARRVEAMRDARALGEERARPRFPSSPSG